MHPKRKSGRLRLRVLTAAVWGALPLLATANPVDPNVVAGQATFQQAGSTLTVNNSPGAIIEWRGFSIGQGELTRFVQQSASSQVLNRITGQDPSQILGALQ
ncbi:MAG: filamentous hemagglutinin N-terminal domain-containing protein, partial [Betaproteobacteria bacterium]|nr:filamentous hemagglutinin N-terminal domain-containing protein [Betaproteobacteria bacterium]